MGHEHTDTAVGSDDVPLERLEAEIATLAGHLDAATCRELSYSKVRALSRAATPQSDAEPAGPDPAGRCEIQGGPGPRGGPAPDL